MDIDVLRREIIRAPGIDVVAVIVRALHSKANSSPLGQNGRQFADDIFRCIFVNENVCISINISLKFVHKGQINNIAALFQIMAWCRLGDKPLSNLWWQVYWRI